MRPKECLGVKLSFVEEERAPVALPNPGKEGMDVIRRKKR